MAYRWTVIGMACMAATCSPKDKPKAAPDPVPVDPPRLAPLTVHRFDADPVVLPRQMAFRVLETGKAPHRALRYALTRTTTTHTAQTAVTSRNLRERTWSETVTMPPIRNGFAITVPPSGLLAVRPLAGEIVGPPTPEATQYIAAWNALGTRRLTVAIDERGQLGSIKFNDDLTTSRSQREVDDLVQRFLLMLIPMPEEPIGIGAKWQVVTALRQRPAVVKQTATYTLRAQGPKGWTIDVEILRVGEPQTLLEPGTPEDTVIELVALVRRATGTMTVDPSLTLPTGTLSIGSSLHIRVLSRREGVSEEIAEDEGTAILTATAPTPMPRAPAPAPAAP